MDGYNGEEISSSEWDEAERMDMEEELCHSCEHHNGDCTCAFDHDPGTVECQDDYWPADNN